MKGKEDSEMEKKMDFVPEYPDPKTSSYKFLINRKHG